MARLAGSLRSDCADRGVAARRDAGGDRRVQAAGGGADDAAAANAVGTAAAGDERSAKAAIYGLNREGRPTRELEEAWIVQALVREDGLTQVEAAELLGRHKSWVCRRLALLEKLAIEAREDLRLGLLSVTAARSLVRLPAGNQAEVLVTARREGLTSVELRDVVELLEQAPAASRRSTSWPSRARPWQQCRATSVAGLGSASERGGQPRRPATGHAPGPVARMENWLRHRGRADLTVHDRGLLAPALRAAGAGCRRGGGAGRSTWASETERP